LSVDYRDLHSFLTRRSSDLSLNNILVYDFGAEARVRINGDDSTTEFLNERLTFSNWEVVLRAGVTVEDLLTVSNQDVEFPEGSEDRKSTRLNSSHVKISYAA